MSTFIHKENSMRTLFYLILLLPITGCSHNEDFSERNPTVNTNNNEGPYEQSAVGKFNPDEILKSDKNLYEAFKSGLLNQESRSPCKKIPSLLPLDLEFEDSKYMEIKYKIDLDDEKSKIDDVQFSVHFYTEETCSKSSKVLKKYANFDIQKTSKISESEIQFELSLYEANVLLSENFCEQANDKALYGHTNWNDESRFAQIHHLLGDEKRNAFIEFKHNGATTVFLTRILLPEDETTIFEEYHFIER